MSEEPATPAGRSGAGRSRVVLAVDPGREKCGVAVARGRDILARAVLPTAELLATVQEWSARFGVGRILLGGGTGSEAIRRALARPDLPPLEPVVEGGTTLEARRRYFAEHPPRGWRRLVPLSMQVPPEPYDDYVAVLLIERAGEGAG